MNKRTNLNLGGYVYLIPFLMTLLGMYLYNRFPLYDPFWFTGGQIMSFFFVSVGTILLMSAVLQRANEK